MTGYASRLLEGPQEQPAEQNQGGGYASRLLDTGSLQTTPKSQAAPKPQNGNIITRTIDAVRGKQDPAYKDVPTLDFDAKDTAGGLGWLGSAFTGQDDKAHGDILQKSLGSRFKRRFQDANGSDIIEYTDETGQVKQGYINKPGLDMYDVGRGVAGAIPYALGGLGVSSIMKGAPLALRAAGQAGAGGATSIAGDIAAKGLGSNQDVDKSKALWAAGGAGAFEAIPGRALAPIIGGGIGFGVGLSEFDRSSEQAKNDSTINALVKGGVGVAAGVGINALARKYLGMTPGTYVQGGKLTPQGEKAAVEAGVAPQELQGALAEEFGKTYAKTKDAGQAAIAATRSEFNIPVTRGQLSKDPQALLDEKAMRYGVHGENAKSTIQEFDKQQTQAIRQATIGTYAGVKERGIQGTIAPHRSGATEADFLADSVRGGLQQSREVARQAESAAWKDVAETALTPDAAALMPQVIGGKLGGMRPDPELTKTAWKMGQELEAFIKGEPAKESLSVFGPNATNLTVGDMRKRLRIMKDAAENNTDKAMSQAIYKGFDDWFSEAAKAGHFPAEVVAKERAARQVSVEVKGLFEPRNGGAMTAAGVRIQKALKDADSAEGVLNAVIGDVTMKGAPREGTVAALGNIKQALNRFGDKEAGKQAWDDIRLAYWQKIALKKNGDLQTPAQILENIKLAEHHQGSVYRTLFEPQEIAKIKRLQRALEQVVWKDPNPSGTATAAAGYARQFLGHIVNMIPYGKAALEFSKIPQALGSVNARRAISQDVKSVVPSLGPAGGAAGTELNQGLNALYSQDR